MRTAPRLAREEIEPPSVLVVDDVRANLIAMEVLLEGLGCRTVCVESGGMALLQLLKQDFALVLLDVQMPDMDGYEVAHYARQNPNTVDVPIIFLTAGQHTEEHALRGYGSGAVDFLFKPVNPDILRSKVRVFLELYSSRRLLAQTNRRLESANLELASTVEARTRLADSLRESNQKLEDAYRELQATQSQLVQSAKMASLGQLVAGVAHEINNPLAFVLSHLSTTQRSLAELREASRDSENAAAAPLWNRAQSRLADMQLGLDRIRDLVVKLRTFSRLDEGERKRVNVHESVDSVLTILSHRTKGHIEVRTEFGAPEMLECFPGPLNQAIMNLLSNAIEAVGEGGEICVRTGADGDQFLISVLDNGPGIPPEIRDRITEPFFTTKAVGQGTGLGLSITYAIVQKHAGTLEFSEREGGGTVATIRLPIPATSSAPP